MNVPADLERWLHYVREAQRSGVRAVRALPLRIPLPAPPGRSATVGVLTCDVGLAEYARTVVAAPAEAQGRAMTGLRESRRGSS